MNKQLLLLCATLSLLVACTPKTAKSTAGDTAVKKETAPTGPAIAPPSATNGPGDAQLAAAKTKFPDVTLDALKKGHSIYYGACTNCHGAKTITHWDESQWKEILDDMASKAQLNTEEKDATWKYIMAIKLSAK